ncbi:MAG TPA: hypothetical protein VGW11_09995 [Solirubrobacteraceae bacterium]|nr:hypothetical protein [Solirubrobacteraceae bacterium]
MDDVPNAPAAWRIERGADRQEVEDLVNRLAEHMGIATPEIRDDYVLLPANYIHVSRALYQVDPAWEEKELIIPPTP